MLQARIYGSKALGLAVEVGSQNGESKKVHLLNDPNASTDCAHPRGWSSSVWSLFGFGLILVVSLVTQVPLSRPSIRMVITPLTLNPEP